MKRRQFIKMISASVVAGVVAPVCVLSKQNKTTVYLDQPLVIGEMLDTPAEGTVIVQEGYGGSISLNSGGKFERYKYRMDQEGNMYIRYLGDDYGTNKSSKQIDP